MTYIALGVLIVVVILFLKNNLNNSTLKRSAYALLILIGAITLVRFGQPLIAFLGSLFFASLPYLKRFLPLLLTLSKYRSQFKSSAVKKPKGTMTKQEACEILDVAENASPEEIKSAYQKLMKKYHPDKGGSEYFASQLNEAKDLLLHS
jgi:hypothetical protein